jgi:ABC-type phosphate/phosphonate transport system substrate-binding protein
VVVRADSDAVTVADLKGATVAVGAIDSPQSTLIPLSYLRGEGSR